MDTQAHIAALLQQGEAQIQDQDSESAIDTFSKILTLDPGHQKAYLNRGATYYSLALFDEAQSDLEMAVQLDPTDAEAMFWLGMTLHELGLVLNLAAAERPGWVRTINGVQYDYQLQLVALQYFDKAILLYPDYFFVYQRGILLECIGHFQAARHDYEDILGRTDLECPDYRHGALIGRARTFLGEGDIDQARHDLVTYNAIQDQNGKPYARVDIEELVIKYRTYREQQNK